MNFSDVNISDKPLSKHQTGMLVLLSTCAVLTFLIIVCNLQLIFQQTIPATVLTIVFCLSGLS